MYSNSTNQQTNNTEYIIPQWVCDVIYEISTTKEVTLEQAAKLIILQGALYYEIKKEENKHNA